MLVDCPPVFLHLAGPPLLSLTYRLRPTYDSEVPTSPIALHSGLENLTKLELESAKWKARLKAPGGLKLQELVLSGA